MEEDEEEKEDEEGLPRDRRCGTQGYAMIVVPAWLRRCLTPDVPEGDMIAASRVFSLLVHVHLFIKRQHKSTTQAQQVARKLKRETAKAQMLQRAAEQDSKAKEVRVCSCAEGPLTVMFRCTSNP